MKIRDSVRFSVGFERMGSSIPKIGNSVLNYMLWILTKPLSWFF